MTLLKTEPARLSAIAAAVLVAVAAFGLPITDAQTAALLALAAAILGGGEAVRSQVTPVAKLDPPQELPAYPPL